MERGLLLIPGGSSDPHHPLLDRSWQTGLARGAEALHVEWPADRPTSRDPADSAAMVNDQVAAALATFAVPRPVLVGKSLGTLAAEVAADRALPAIWHTPLLTVPRCVTALRNATAPFLLVGGTADPWWDGAVARALTPYVLEVVGGDHNLADPGELDQAAAAVEGFLDERETCLWTVRAPRGGQR